MKKQIKEYKKVRQVWEINPKTRVKENKKKEQIDPCEFCGNEDGAICLICQRRV